MIHSMTAFGSSRIESDDGSLAIEFRTVNSRYLDINIRMPDELRFAEAQVREQISRYVTRGKVDVRVNYTRHAGLIMSELDAGHLDHMAKQLEMARRVIPDVMAPRLPELLSMQADRNDSFLDTEIWTDMCQKACEQALKQLQAARQREGQRLAEAMLAIAAQMNTIVDEVENELPALTQAHHEKIATRLRDVLDTVSPDGFSQISGEELSARIAQEASLFSLRNDIAEELARLRSHLAELRHLLSETSMPAGTVATERRKNPKGSAGKRLDFLCQEMNREANTVGSKAASLDTTRASIDLKLLIEQLREQAQNIE